MMKFRFTIEFDKVRSRVTGWQRVVAIGLAGLVVIAALWLVPAPEVVTAVSDSLVRILGP